MNFSTLKETIRRTLRYMIIDIIIIGLILLCSFLGFRKGFAYSFIHTAGWVMSIMLAFMLTDRCKPVIAATELAQKYIPEYPASNMMPEMLQGTFVGFTHEIILSVITFLVLFVAIKLIFSILLFIYTRSIGGFTGFIDGTLGLALGMLKGIILVYICLLVVVPIAESFMPEIVPQLDSLIAASQLAEDLYNNNPFIFLLQNTFLN